MHDTISCRADSLPSRETTGLRRKKGNQRSEVDQNLDVSTNSFAHRIPNTQEDEKGEGRRMKNEEELGYWRAMVIVFTFHREVACTPAAKKQQQQRQQQQQTNVMVLILRHIPGVVPAHPAFFFFFWGGGGYRGNVGIRK